MIDAALSAMSLGCTGVDGFIPNLVKLMGLASLFRVTQILRLPFDQWPLEVFSALHLTPKKSADDNVDVNTRLIKLLSALFRIQSKLYAPLIQVATAPSESGCRQYAGFKGSSAHALRHMLHTVITQSLALRADVRTMFLDVSGAFDEINRQAILRVAKMYPFLRGVVHEGSSLHVLEAIRGFWPGPFRVVLSSGG